MSIERLSKVSAGFRVVLCLVLWLSLFYSGSALTSNSIWPQGSPSFEPIVSPAANAPAMFTALTAYTNSTPILIPATQNSIAGVSSPYPSTINVPTAGTITAVSVTLNGFHHTQQADIDALLVGPNGAKFIFMSDAGRANGAGPIDLTFDDAAATLAPTPPAAAITATGSFQPTNYTTGDAFAAPAPAGPYLEAAPAASATFASAFAGSNQQGNWSLYINDDAGGDFGSCNGGWTLNITTSVAAAGTTTTVSSSLNPSLTTDSVSFSAHVVKTSDSSNVTAGTVTFVDTTTSTVLGSNVALNASGVASTGAIAGLAERRHLITATYNPDPAFITSNGTLFQTVDFQTTNPSLATFCNNNSVTIPDAGTAGPAVQYPSHITVSGLGYVVGYVKVTLKNVTHTAAQDMDMMLVSPTGQNLIILSDSGGSTSNVTLIIDDNAPSQIAAGGAWAPTGTTVSSRPVDRTAGDTFQAPAPAGGYNSPGPVGSATTTSAFGGFSPNGVWSLYMIDDAGGDTGAIAGGWCVQILVPSAASVPVAGRVMGTTGAGVSRAFVTLTDESGRSQTVLTSSFGYYQFDGVETGRTYVIGVTSKQYEFASRVVTINDAVADLDFLPIK